MGGKNFNIEWNIESVEQKEFREKAHQSDQQNTAESTAEKDDKMAIKERAKRRFKEIIQEVKDCTTWAEEVDDFENNTNIRTRLRKRKRYGDVEIEMQKDVENEFVSLEDLIQLKMMISKLLESLDPSE